MLTQKQIVIIINKDFPLSKKEDASPHWGLV